MQILITNNCYIESRFECKFEHISLSLFLLPNRIESDIPCAAVSPKTKKQKIENAPLKWIPTPIGELNKCFLKVENLPNARGNVQNATHDTHNTETHSLIHYSLQLPSFQIRARDLLCVAYFGTTSGTTMPLNT